MTVPAVPDVGVNPVTDNVSVGTGVEVSSTGAPPVMIMFPPPNGTVTTTRAVKVSNLTEITGESVG